MDTVPTFHRIRPTFMRGKDGVVNYFKYVDMATKRKFYQPVIGRKGLSKMFEKKSDAFKYANNVLFRYKRLLAATPPPQEEEEDGV